MTIPDKAVFQPSAEALEMWLATRKPSLVVGGTSVPGLLSDAGNSSDTAWFFLGLLGEVLGLITLILGGAINGGVFLPLAMSAAAAFVCCNYCFAVLLHRREGLRCRLRAQKGLEANPAEIVRLSNELSRGKLLDFFLKAGIGLIVLVKILGILLLGVFSSIVLYVPFLVIYIVVAYVHVQHTGYCLAYRLTERRFASEYKRFEMARRKPIAMEDRHFRTGSFEFEPKDWFSTVVTPSPLLGIPIRHIPHAIVQGEEPGSCAENRYEIRAHGVLTDDDVLSLVSGQSDVNQVVLLNVCRKIQLKMLPW
jgi:hypothetical protein